ncbi:MAG: carboxylating nicotinate-nucleotide diphosphorylase [Gammaproteobacteria bacterium]|nr:carboxylating nicotinate-nucleotide diphosphorylase [Gammaproteobacteria bacterium]
MTITITPQHITQQVQLALAEDIGTGDVTANLIPDKQQITAQVICREDAILCGTQWFNEVFQQLDSSIEISWTSGDSDKVEQNQIICMVKGLARPILTGERTALNFLQTLSGTATITNEYVNALEGTNTKLLDTRKTIPNLRLAQKYAVSCGGGINHRIGLYDAILIKENHITAAGSIAKAVSQAKQTNSELFLEVEVETLEQLQQAIDAGAQRALLDNMNTDTLKQAVETNNGQLELEASGGITIKNIKEVALTGVDYISIGSITKHVQAIDLSMIFSNQSD